MGRFAVITGAGIVALAVLAGPGPGAAAQEVPTRSISEPEMVYTRDFSNLRSLRVLSNGAVLAVEGVGGEVVMLGADGSSDSPVGSHGQGPSEYMAPARILPLAGSDFSLIVDPTQQRLLIVAANGSVIASEPWRLPMLVVPRARGAMEEVYWDEAGAVRMDNLGRVKEGPGPILRARPGQAADTLATITVHDLADRWAASPVAQMFSPGPNGVALFSLDSSPFGAQDEWAVMPDGRVVIARARPYRIDVVSPEGVLTEGSEVSFDPVPVEISDREAFVAAMMRGSQSGSTGSFSSDDGTVTPMRRPPPQVENLEFPEFKPAFPFGGLHVTAGEILVQRHVAEDADHSSIDVFDAAGRRTGHIEIPAKRTLVAATAQALYAIVYNEFDVQLLERYAR